MFWYQIQDFADNRLVFYLYTSILVHYFIVFVRPFLMFFRYEIFDVFHNYNKWIWMQ